LSCSFWGEKLRIDSHRDQRNASLFKVRGPSRLARGGRDEGVYGSDCERVISGSAMPNGEQAAALETAQGASQQQFGVHEEGKDRVGLKPQQGRERGSDKSEVRGLVSGFLRSLFGGVQGQSEWAGVHALESKRDWYLVELVVGVVWGLSSREHKNIVSASGECVCELVYVKLASFGFDPEGDAQERDAHAATPKESSSGVVSREKKRVHPGNDPGG
jgi:hypothetical protein